MKMLLIVCVLGIVSWAAWQIAPRGPESATSTGAEDARPTGQTELTPLDTPRLARTNQFGLSRHTSAPETNVANEPIAMELRRQEAQEQQRQRWERRRQELRQQEAYKEMFAKEDEWAEKSKALKKGMTLQQVIAVMGTPTRVRVPDESSQDGNEWKEVSGDALKSVSGTAMVLYSPDGEGPVLGGSSGMFQRELPFGRWSLIFDEQGKLANWRE